MGIGNGNISKRNWCLVWYPRVSHCAYKNSIFCISIGCFWNILKIVSKISNRDTLIRSLNFNFKYFCDQFPQGSLLDFGGAIFRKKLTHLFPMHPLSTPWKHQKTFRFSDVFRGYRKGALGTNGLKYGYCVMVIGKWFWRCSDCNGGSVACRNFWSEYDC